MLKFNIKEHKLEELEKYGVVKNIYAHCISLLVRSYEDDITLDIDTRTYFIEFTVDDTFYKDVLRELLDILYELIKDGLVIKEENDE